MDNWDTRMNRLWRDIEGDYYELDQLRDFPDPVVVTLADGQRMPAAAARKQLRERLEDNERELEAMNSIRVVDWPLELG